MSHFCDGVKRMRHRRSVPWKRDTPFAKPNGLTNVRLLLRSSSRSSHACLPVGRPLSKPSRVRSPLNTPKPRSVVCCRTLHTKTSNRLPLVLVSPACPCKASSAGVSGPMNRGARSSSAKSRRTWDKPMGCWCSIPRGFPSPVGSRWGWPGSGVAGWARLTIAKWEYISAMFRIRDTRWWMSGCTCRRIGQRIKEGDRSAVFQERLSLRQRSN